MENRCVAWPTNACRSSVWPAPPKRSAPTTAPAVGTGILDGWLVHEGDHADIDGVEVRSVPLLMKDPATTAEMVRAGLDLAGLKVDPRQ